MIYMPQRCTAFIPPEMRIIHKTYVLFDTLNSIYTIFTEYLYNFTYD